MRVLFLQDLGINESLAITDLSAFLKTHGHYCDLLIERDEKNLFKLIKDFSADLFIIPCDIFGHHHWALRMASNVKRLFGKLIIFCGTYTSFYPQIIDNPNVDIVCIGESEYALLELIEKLEENKDISSIQNLWVKKDGKIYKNDLRQLISNLDELPLPDREIYFKYKYIRDFSLKRFASGRGCPNCCSYCYNPLYREKYRNKGKYTRRKSVIRVIQEIEDVRRKSTVKSIHFSDDLFIHDKDWVLKFSQAYKEKINLTFTCNAVADLIDEELISALRDANCSGIAIGIESGNEKLRNFVLNKNITNHQIIKAAKLIKRYGLFLTTFNMIAFPNETLENAFETLEINAKIKADNIRLYFTFPLPETQLTNYALKNKLINRNQLEGISNITMFPKRPMFNSNHNKQFENLFYLFYFGSKFPWLIPIMKRILKLVPVRFTFVLSPVISLISLYKEKKNFKISWISGIRFFLHTGGVKKRTKVFNNYMP